ncbi:hypothetical protein PVAP13_1KG498300 [Panicum virgatum]|uniref:Uncharacterized protein n=1 Tax=Panicum virgatum TaxID=38727 RepID=A0A8T0XQP3_PANVG|nr:hypothetical protein PVAP13_1KG498300 [Panicum virgatum]
MSPRPPPRGIRRSGSPAHPGLLEDRDENPRARLRPATRQADANLFSPHHPRPLRCAAPGNHSARELQTRTPHAQLSSAPPPRPRPPLHPPRTRTGPRRRQELEPIEQRPALAFPLIRNPLPELPRTTLHRATLTLAWPLPHLRHHLVFHLPSSGSTRGGELSPLRVS